MRPLSSSDRRRLLLIAAALSTAVLALGAWVELVAPLPGERAVLDWQGSHERFGVDEVSVLTVFGDLASPIVACLVVLAVGAVGLEALGRRFALLVALCASVAVGTTALKLVFGTTPLWGEVSEHANYPSGHTAFATALAGLVAVACWQAGRPVAATVAAGVAAGMGPAMVLGGWHLPSDVIAGYAIGAAWLLAALAVAAPRPVAEPRAVAA